LHHDEKPKKVAHLGNTVFAGNVWKEVNIEKKKFKKPKKIRNLGIRVEFMSHRGLRSSDSCFSSSRKKEGLICLPCGIGRWR
jgi:hypothetical protein